MSIFRATFKPYVQRQVNARQDLVKVNQRDSRFLQYTSGKNSWCRMTSMVNYDSPDGRYKGDQLSRKYVLEGGTLYPSPTDPTKFSLRRGVSVAAGSYGGNLGDHSLGIRPMPGIVSVNIKSKSAYGSLREAEVKFMAWDKGQVEDLEILFMRTGYSVLLEYGWSMYLDTYQNDSGSVSSGIIDRLPLSNVKMKNFIEPTINAFDDTLTPPTVYAQMEFLRHKFSGNYDGMLAYVRNFSITMLPNGGWECTAILISIGDVLDSLKINSSTYPLNTTAQNNIPAQNNKLLTRFEQIFEPMLDLDTDYIKNIVMGKNLSKYQKTGNDQDPNVDFGLFKVNFNSVPSSLLAASSKTMRGDLHYISFGAFIAIMNTQFGLYDPRNGNNIPIIDMEAPYPGYGSYGNGLCLASEDSISIDPEVCLVENKFATFITGVPTGFDLGSKLPFNPFHFQGNKSLGIIGNIYVCIEYLINTFKGMASNSDGTVDMRKYIETVLHDISYAMGSINSFGFFVTDSTAAIIDTHYVADPFTEAQTKFTVNILGTNSVIRNFNITSKVFESQATMVAIAAQDRANISAVNSSTYNYLNKGLTDRVIKQKLDYDGAASLMNASSSADADKAYKDKLAQMVIDMRTYVGSYLVHRDLSQIDAQRQAANSNLNSILIKINTDANFKAIIPMSVEITFDGIGGITQGEIFKLNPDTLPKEYVNKNLGFIVTAISNHIEGSDWITTIGTQCCLLHQDEAQVSANVIDKNAINANIQGIYQTQQAAAAADLTKQVYTYNNLIKLIVAIFGPKNPTTVSIINSLVDKSYLFQPNTAPVSTFTYSFLHIRTDTSLTFNINSTNFPGYPVDVIKNLIRTNPIPIETFTKARIVGTNGVQYVLNPFATNTANAVTAVNNLVQLYPDYNSITNDTLRNAIIHVLVDIQDGMEGDSNRGGGFGNGDISLPLLYLAPNATNPTLYRNVPLNVQFISTDKF